MRCALIKDNYVLEVQELSEEQVQAMAINYQAIVDVSSMEPQPQVGWELQGSQFIVPADVVVSKKITKLALRNRFTITEKVMIEAAAAQNTTDGFLLKSWLADFNVSTYVDLSRTDTITGINFLEQKGLIASGRADQILNVDISDIERYRG